MRLYSNGSSGLLIREIQTNLSGDNYLAFVANVMSENCVRQFRIRMRSSSVGVACNLLGISHSETE